jgi:sugar phosphate isomerase/epimerase
MYNPPMNRRTFIESSVATALVSSLPGPVFAATPHQIDKIGVQLYTVRDAMKTDVAGTLAKVAAIGYKEMEFAGYFGRSPKEIRTLLDKNSVTSPSCHVPYDTVENHWPEALDSAHQIGQTFLVCPWLDEKLRQADGYKKVAEQFNIAGEASKKAGIQFCYHNHFWEFVPDKGLGGQFPYDFLLQNTDPNFLKMELDLCWISVAGQDPVAYFEKYPGRFPLVHVKDMKSLPNVTPEQVGSLDLKEVAKNMTSVGNGVIDWKRIFAHSEKGGIQHYFVENDYPKEAFADLTASYAYLSKLRF